MSTSPGKINLEDKINNLSNEEEKKSELIFEETY